MCLCMREADLFIQFGLTLWEVGDMGVNTLGDTSLIWMVYLDISPMCCHALQLQLWTGHRGMQSLGTNWTVSIQAPYPTLDTAREDEMGFQIPADHKDRGERLVQQDKSEMLEQQVLRIPLVQGVVGWSTQGGGKLDVQMSQELSWCTQGGLVEPGGLTREEQPSTSACLMIQTTSTMVLECKVTTMCMEWSISHIQANHSICQLLTYHAWRRRVWCFLLSFRVLCRTLCRTNNIADSHMTSCN